MKKHVSRVATGLAAGAVGLLVAGGFALPAEAAKVKSTKTEAKFVSYDAKSKTLTVKILNPGKRPKNRELSLKKGKQAQFKIKPEGSVLLRTSVTADGQRSSIDEIPENKTLNIYWVPDENDPDVRFARKIDMVYTDEELEARDEKRLQEARAKGQVSD